MTYEVSYEIQGLIEVEAASEADAIAKAKEAVCEEIWTLDIDVNSLTFEVTDQS